MTIRLNIERLKADLALACAQANRSTEDVTIVAVSKTRTAEEVVEAVECGLLHFGENRVDEFVAKRNRIQEISKVASDQIVWHFIGHVQSKKVKTVVANSDIIDSVDSLRLAEAISRRAGEMEMADPIDILLQVNISGEEQKFGIAIADLPRVAENVEALPNIKVQGLMGMASFTADEDRVTRQFLSLQSLFNKVSFSHMGTAGILSMGMSGDYGLAIKAGSTEIRVGTAIFGKRS